MTGTVTALPIGGPLRPYTPGLKGDNGPPPGYSPPPVPGATNTSTTTQAKQDNTDVPKDQTERRPTDATSLEITDNKPTLLGG